MSSHRPFRALKRVHGVALALGLSTAMLLSSGVTAPVAQAAPGDLPAVFATGGTGRYRDIIQWLQWGDYDTQFKGKAKPDVPVLDYGETKTYNNVREIAPGTKLRTTCTLSNLQHLGHKPFRDQRNDPLTEAQAKGPLVATIPGGWAGDVLDNLYNVGGPGSWSNGEQTWSEGMTYPKDYVNRNRMVIGLGNGYAYNGMNAKNSDKPWGTPGTDPSPTGFSSRLSFDYSCSASLETPTGTRNVPVQGLVFADAEASSKRSGRIIDGALFDEWGDEWVQASTTQNVTWRVLDRLRSANCGGVTSNAEISNNGKTLRLMPTGDECVYQEPGKYTSPNGIGGPSAVMLMEGATSATISLQGAGYSAVALGLVLATDFGDAPESYGNAGSLYEPAWRDGAIASTTDVFSNNLSLASMHVSQGTPSLGKEIDAEPYQQYSNDALGDDIDDLWWSDDEDAISGEVRIPAAPGLTWSKEVTCNGEGELYGWIDWDRNGKFEDAERSGWTDTNHDGKLQAGERGVGPACSGGKATLTWTIPENVSIDQANPAADVKTFMRLRITNDRDASGKPIEPAATGITGHGEVEDYAVTLYTEALLKLVKQVDNSAGYAPTPLKPEQWTLTATQNGQTRQGDGVLESAAVKPGTVTFSEAGKTAEAREGYILTDTVCAKHPQMNTAMTSVLSADKKSIELKNREWVVCTLINKPKPAVVEWSKVDAAGTKLPGSIWKLTGPSHPSGLNISDCIAGNCAGSQDKDPTPGHFRVEVNKWGDYAVQETAPPTGYTKSNTTFSISTTDATHLTGTPKSATGVTGDGIINQPAPGTLGWKKVDTVGATIASAPSAWTLTGPQVPANTIVQDCTAANCATGNYKDTNPAVGEFNVTVPKWGEYKITEQSAPAGYIAATGDFAFDTIDKDHLSVGLKTVAGVNNGGVVNQSQTGSVTWNKVDAANKQPLSGSSWNLTGPTGGTSATQVIEDCVVADATGCANKLDKDPVGGTLRVEGLALGAYTLTEQAAPAGYKLDSKTTHNFELKPSELNFTFKDPFTNEKTSVPTLPLTGGLGADLFIIGGGILGVAAMGFGIMRRRRQQHATVTVR
ncbi:Predicted outer membrane protein [Actinomyces bovis]|uniref:Predicted outer membrane protein n=1 Tax=Actinomyces bovis TaxID=1658 RepID=A0ABY1VLN6_9ACTO|nr:CshA/CshB family fibrillar adhesin-related protein [Actinomyces bovis]SPT52925.1 Predicted outer membrane protein [Actinomyces bovis]VEG55089.1 Predicted outer membrane protein [Actinomyces israelii]